MAFDKAELNLNTRLGDEASQSGTSNGLPHSQSQTAEILPEFQIKPIECLGTNLQLTFTLMKESIRRSIDPSFFIKAIGLDENIQQVSNYNQILKPYLLVFF